MKRRSLMLLTLLMGALLGWFARDLVRPEYPKRWDQLKLNMTAEEARSVVPNLDTSWREMKGYDQTEVDFGYSYWWLGVSYNQEGRVSTIQKKYSDKRCGLMNKFIFSSSSSVLFS